jgi:hypothetical protein
MPPVHHGSTLQELLKRGERVFAHHAQLHPSCVHFSMLDLPKLIERLGPDFDLADHLGLFCTWLRCSRCGEKGNVSLSFSPALRHSTDHKSTTWGDWTAPRGPQPIFKKGRRRR